MSRSRKTQRNHALKQIFADSRWQSISSLSENISLISCCLIVLRWLKITTVLFFDTYLYDTHLKMLPYHPFPFDSIRGISFSGFREIEQVEYVEYIDHIYTACIQRSLCSFFPIHHSKYESSRIQNGMYMILCMIMVCLWFIIYVHVYNANAHTMS